MSRPGFPVDMSQTISVTNTYDPWNQPPTNGTDPCFIAYRFEDKVGSNSPSWPFAKSTNSYLRSMFTWNQQPLSVNGTNDKGGGHVDTFSGNWGNTFGLGNHPWGGALGPTSMGAGQASVRARLINKLISQIQSHRVNLGELLQTRAQTASMVASTANRLAGTVMSLRRGKFVDAARYLTGADPRSRTRIRVSKSGRTSSSLGGIPEQWLALQYGWRPLVQDIYNSLENVRRAWNDPAGECFTARAGVSERMDDLQLFQNRSQPHGPTFVTEVTNRELQGNAAVVYGVQQNFAANLSQFGITNPASLTWELLPWSFVADWFIPIGPYLESLDYHRGLVFKYGWLSIKARQGARRRIDSSIGTNGGIKATWFQGRGSGSAMVFTREVLGSFPTPPLPTLKDPFSLTHVANATSLLATAFRGGKLPR